MTGEDNQKKKSRKPSKKIFYIIIILFFILAFCSVLYYDYIASDDSFLGPDSASITDSENSYLEELMNRVPFLNNTLGTVLPSNEFNISDVQLDKKTVGEEDIGFVTVEGPYGNPNSTVKIAYLLGQHPRESNAHDAIYEGLLKSSDDLNYSYYVYWINVTGESSDFEQSRMNGQILAQDIAVPAMIEEGFNLVIDVHASNGAYVQDPYIFAPVENDTVANLSANNIINSVNYIIYYEPASYSSPQYSTIPLEDGGMPSIVFEMRGIPGQTLEQEATDFVHAVDNLLFD